MNSAETCYSTSNDLPRCAAPLHQGTETCVAEGIIVLEMQSDLGIIARSKMFEAPRWGVIQKRDADAVHDCSSSKISVHHLFTNSYYTIWGPHFHTHPYLFWMKLGHLSHLSLFVVGESICSHQKTSHVLNAFRVYSTGAGPRPIEDDRIKFKPI